MTQYQDKMRRFNRSAFLSETDVMDIKRRLGHFAPAHERMRVREWPRDIAKLYMVGTETIRRIDRGDTWGWLTPEQPTDPKGEAEMQARIDESLKVLQGKLKEEM